MLTSCDFIARCAFRYKKWRIHQKSEEKREQIDRQRLIKVLNIDINEKRKTSKMRNGRVYAPKSDNDERERESGVWPPRAVCSRRTTWGVTSR